MNITQLGIDLPLKLASTSKPGITVSSLVGLLNDTYHFIDSHPTVAPIYPCQLYRLQAIGRAVRFPIRLIGVNPNSTGSQKIRKKPGLCIVSDVMSCQYQTNKESPNLTNDSPSISSQIFLVTSSPTYALAIASLKLRLLTSLVRRKNGGDTICPASMCL